MTECELPALGPGGRGAGRGGALFPGRAGLAGAGQLRLLARGGGLRRGAWNWRGCCARREGAEALAAVAAAGRGSRPGIVDPETHHTVLPVIIARVEGGAFQVLQALGGRGGRSLPDAQPVGAAAPILRVVS